MEIYSDLNVQTYDPAELSEEASEPLWTERLRGTQWAGVGCALAAVALIAA